MCVGRGGQAQCGQGDVLGVSQPLRDTWPGQAYVFNLLAPGPAAANSFFEANRAQQCWGAGRPHPHRLSPGLSLPEHGPISQVTPLRYPAPSFPSTHKGSKGFSTLTKEILRAVVVVIVVLWEVVDPEAVPFIDPCREQAEKNVVTVPRVHASVHSGPGDCTCARLCAGPGHGERRQAQASPVVPCPEGQACAKGTTARWLSAPKLTPSFMVHV